MMRSFRLHAFWILPVLLLAATACSTTNTPSATPRPAVEGELTRGGNLSFHDEIIAVFEGVSQDSRCPEGVQCVTAGRAYVQLSLVLAGREPADASLVIEPGGETWTRYGGFVVTLTALEPDPPPQRMEGEFIDYTAHIRIEESDE